MAVEAEPLPNERVEVLGQEVGEVEGARLGLLQRGEAVAAGEELVAVGAREPPDGRLLGEETVERPAGATVGVGDEHVAVRCRRSRSPRAAPARCCSGRLCRLAGR